MAACLRTDEVARDLWLSVDNREEKEGREVMSYVIALHAADGRLQIRNTDTSDGQSL